MESFIEYLRDFIEDNLPEHEGQKFDDSYSLADALTERMNDDGSATYSRKEAEEYLKAWWDDCGEFIENFTGNFGELPANAFLESEKFQVQMIITGLERVFTLCALNEPFTLSKSRIKKIINEVKTLPSVF